MKVLLDTNIIISRENPKTPDIAVNKLYFAIDKFRYDKYIHPATVVELSKYFDPRQKEILFAKLESYFRVEIRPELPSSFLDRLSVFPISSENDRIDNEMLFQIFDQRIDYLITEDKKMHQKAKALGIGNKVFSIETFLQLFYQQFPDLVDYKVLSVKKSRFGQYDIDSPFFDSFKRDYPGFVSWFKSKSNEPCYSLTDSQGCLNGFLYIKDEGLEENYSAINPAFAPKRRLKIGTFKVIASGFRLGERFLKIVFDNALKRNVEEIYVTLFENRDELVALKQFFESWGFTFHGKNTKTGETVLVKPLRFIPERSPKENFPKYNALASKRFLPIKPEYHSQLFPDSILRNEVIEDYEDKKAYQYAIQKVYVSWADSKGTHPGDLVLIYRNGGSYHGVVTTLCIIKDIQRPRNLNEFIGLCQNRSIFTEKELKDFWLRTNNLCVITLLYLESLKRKVIINQLWDNGIIEPAKGPRPFDPISEADYKTIIDLSEK